MRRSCLLALYDQTLDNIVQSIRRRPDANYIFGEAGNLPTIPAKSYPTLVIDASGFPSQGIDSVAMALATLYRRGFRRFIVAHTRGHRFIGNGLGPDTGDVRIDVYGSPGDYLGSGVNGAAIYVHRSAQDHLAQIMRAGKLVIYGDAGQSFGYAAQGGEAYVLGSTAGRLLANAAGRPRVVINGTCTNHLAESFAAGDPLDGGGFAVLNSIAFDDDGQVIELDTPYPGEHLFSMASGGAVYLRDPHRRVTEDQLDGGAFDRFDDQDWALIRPYLEENARLFGVSIDRLLTVNGKQWHPASVYRKIAPCAGRALQTEEAWAKKEQSVS
jgi:glutamate synthase domain-containing protein 3